MLGSRPSSSRPRSRRLGPAHHYAKRQSDRFLVGQSLLALTALVGTLLYVSLSFRYLVGTTTTTTSTQVGRIGRPVSAPQASRAHDAHKTAAVEALHAAAATDGQPAREAPIDVCRLRTYPPHRYYDVRTPLAEQPAFLTHATTYIYGAWPHVLGTGTASGTGRSTKICVDQSEWRPAPTDTTATTTTATYPFADGTNPSIVSVARLRALSHPSVTAFLQALPPTVVWIATVCLTNSQCTWHDSPAQLHEFAFSNQENPDTLRTLLLLLDADFSVIEQTTIGMVVDAPWGRRQKLKPTADAATPRLLALDDARLFVHDGQVWLSYREGPSFGYESQVLNPLHLGWSSSSSSSSSSKGTPPTWLTATVQAAETTYFCCGRNMALMQDRRNGNGAFASSSQLLSLTWVDPITVQAVNTTAQPVPNGKRQAQDLPPLAGRRLAAQPAQHLQKPAKSHIHGTNAFMVYLPSPRDEFLGVAHFHRPNDRASNPYARFGHHYTHAFFTVTAVPPYRLTALSAEFVYARGDDRGGAADAEIIQFSSGLEVTEDGQRVVLAYGINDCEAAVTTVPWTTVADLLRPVAAGQQVVDLMQALIVP
jgi:hypothetical protein